jgi:hypothetical protein
MTISNKNFSTTDVADIPVDSEYVGCNFSRRQPDTGGAQPVGIRLFPGDDTPRTFRNCNLVNCETPPGSTVIDCNTTITEYGVFDFEETITVDGVIVSTTTYEKQVIYGRYDPVGETYVYEPAPIEVSTGPSE